jgi:hypothetical protein
MRLMILLCVGGAAVAGTYGGVSRAEIGWSASIDCSVGSWSDHAAEGQAHESCKRRAAAELDRRAAELERAWQRFLARGRSTLLARLDRRAREGASVAVELSLPREEVTATRDVIMSFYVKGQPSPALVLKMGAEFARTQLGGLLASVTARKERDVADTQQLLIGLDAHRPVYLLRFALERRDEIAELARAVRPLPKKYDWAGDQRAALVTARILDAVRRDRPFPDDTFALAAQLDADARARAALMMASFSSDPRIRALSDDPLVAELLKL